MKARFAALLVFAAIFMLAMPASADTFLFNSGGTVSAGGAVITFTNAAGTIVASGFNGSGGTKLLAQKSGGGDENGLGLAGLSDLEILAPNFIQLDISGLSKPATFQVALSSVQAGENFSIWISATADCFVSSCKISGAGATGTGVAFDSTVGHPIYITLSGFTGQRYIDITSGNSGDVLIQQAAAVPEPGSIALLGTGLLGFAGAVRRKLSL